ncbi:20612_t:CDS:2, partial [Dentiscutata erythropus]
NNKLVMARNKINQISDADDENNSLVSESSKTKQSYRRSENSDKGSICWKYFQPFKVPKDGEVAKCTIDGCNVEYIWRGSTSNLLRHLKNVHRITPTTAIQPSLTNDKEVLSVIKFIVSSVSPFNVVDYLKFSELVKQPITPVIIKEKIDKVKDRLFSELKPKIRQANFLLRSQSEDLIINGLLGDCLDALDAWKLTNLKFISLNLNYDFLYNLDFYVRDRRDKDEDIIICVSGGKGDDLIRYSLKRWADKNYHEQEMSTIIAAITNAIDKYHSIVEFLGDNRMQRIMQNVKTVICNCNYHKIEFLTLIEQPVKLLINHSNNNDDFIRVNINHFLLDKLPFGIFPKLLQLFKPLEHIEVVTMRNLRDMLINASNILNEGFRDDLDNTFTLHDIPKNDLYEFYEFLNDISEHEILKSFLSFLINSYLNLHQRVGLFLDPHSKSIFMNDEVRKLVLDECQGYYSEIAGINSTKLSNDEIEYYISHSQLNYNENDDLCKWWQKYKNTYPGLATLAVKYLLLLKLDDEIILENLDKFINAYQNNEAIDKIAFLQYNM